MLILVNRHSHGGEGEARFRQIQDRLPTNGCSVDVCFPSNVDDSTARVQQAIEAGTTTIVAAGGDGTVNSVLNAIMDPERDRPRGEVCLGGIGLGSSNDFHKPFQEERFIDGLPIRLDAEKARVIDLGKAVFTDVEGKRHIRYFVLNASVGIVAEGNAFFNEGDRIVRRLKRLHTEIAILYAALVNIARFSPSKVEIRVDDGPTVIETITNVGILKSVHFAGGMRYDTPVTADDGKFDINTWLGMSKFRVLATIAGLYSGKFDGKPQTRCQRGSVVRIEPRQPMHLELDGEIFKIKAAELSVVPKALQVCA